MFLYSVPNKFFAKMEEFRYWGTAITKLHLPRN